LFKTLVCKASYLKSKAMKKGWRVTGYTWQF